MDPLALMKLENSSSSFWQANNPYDDEETPKNNFCDYTYEESEQTAHKNKNHNSHLHKEEKKTKVHKEGNSKYNSGGVNFTVQLAKEKEREKEERLMRRTVIIIVRRLPMELSLKKHLFYVCHVNYFVQVNEGLYLPAEIALAEFSLGAGLCATLQFLLNPGKLPLGSKFEALQWSEKTHGIPIDWTEGENNYEKIHHSIMNFVKRYTSHVPPIFTMPDNLNNNHSISAVKSALSSFSKAAGEDPFVYRIFPLSFLFYELKQKCMESTNSVDNRITLPWALNELIKDVYSHCKDIGCTYHEGKDLSLHCSLSTVKRWTFSVCSNCFPGIGITPQPGRHYPKRKYSIE